MLISYNWLKSYADFDLTPDDLSVLLTDSGLEVESLEKHESIRGGLQGVVSGHVLTCEAHPRADRLSLTRVDVGPGDPLPIVCGAPNVKAGQKVLVALEGTTLYFNNEELTIKPVRIRGEESRGMICAEDELGLGSSHDGIMVLDEDTPVGVAAAKLFDVYEDWIFEIGLTPNRIDAASHIGAARDVVAVINHQIKQKKINIKWPDTATFKPDNTNLTIPVTIEDPDACPRYSSLTISGVHVKESPEWLKNKLIAVGQKPINNIVDVTNFVLQEVGQPLHAFDVDAIKGNRVVVRKPGKNTVFETLDEEKIKLTGNDLMICNAEDAMCMGGILGGIQSGVTAKTTDVFLESACFDPVTIRKSAKHHGIKTEASFRFERGSDPGITLFALKRAALLIKELAGGEISSEISDVYPGEKPPLQLEVKLEDINRLIGKQIPSDEVRNILEDLDFAIQADTGKTYQLIVPSYRVDVTRTADVVEEVLRIYGYNNVEIPEKMNASIVMSPKPDKEMLQNMVSDLLSYRGFNEIMNNSLTRETYYRKHNLHPDRLVHILNPLSQDLNAMRQTLLFGGLESILYNLNRKVHDMKLYELGQTYFLDSRQPGSALPPYHEKQCLALFMTGRVQSESWYADDRPHTFFDLKDAVVAVFKKMGVTENQLHIRQDISVFPFMFASALLVDDKQVGVIGKVNPTVLREFDIKQDVFYGEVDWEFLVNIGSKRHLIYTDVPKFPAVRRDLALLLHADTNFADVKNIAMQTEKKLLKEINLFDVYQDDKLGKNKKSYAISFVFQADKTLTDKEIDKVMNKLTKAFEQKLFASIR